MSNKPDGNKLAHFIMENDEYEVNLTETHLILDHTGYPKRRTHKRTPRVLNKLGKEFYYEELYHE